MATFKVYFAKEPTFLESGTFGTLLLTIPRFRLSHTFVRQVEAEALGDVYHLMQAEVWSPGGEARTLIERLGLSHTSLSVGDVVEDADGRFWECLNRGWRQLKYATRRHTYKGYAIEITNDGLPGAPSYGWEIALDGETVFHPPTFPTVAAAVASAEARLDAARA